MYTDNPTTPIGRRVVIGQMSVFADLEVPFTGEEYVGLIWAADSTLDEGDRMKVVGTLIDSGCQYIVCGGVDCERWHDDADLAFANLEVQSDSLRTDLPMVMTTWHDNESMEDVAFFAINCTNFDDHDFNRLLVLVVGQESERLDCVNRISRVLRAPAGTQTDPSTPTGSVL